MKLSVDTIEAMRDANAVIRWARNTTRLDFVQGCEPKGIYAIPESWCDEICRAILAIAERRLVEAEAKAREELGA